MDKKTKIAVLMGGPSKEAEISRNTGTAIYNALKEKGYNVIPMELQPSTFLYDLKENNVEIVFNALHGLYGEDGRIQSILESVGIPYTGSGVLASAISMDKSATKRYLSVEKISTPQYKIFNKRFDKDLDKIVKIIEQEFTVPLVIKPASQGSSIGVEIVKDKNLVKDAVKNCFGYCDNIVVEEYIKGKELTCGVMEKDGEIIALPIVWIAPHTGAYDYYSKYTKGATDYHCPAPLPEEVTAEVQKLAKDTYRVLGLSGVARIDLMLDEKNKPYVLEANTVPGMTGTSLVPKMAAAMGISFAELCEMILLGAK